MHCTVCPLEMVWFFDSYAFYFFFQHCFRSLCMVHDSECYLWGLIYCLILSNLAILFMYFVLLSQNHIFPAKLPMLFLKVLSEKDVPHI